MSRFFTLLDKHNSVQGNDHKVFNHLYD